MRLFFEEAIERDRERQRDREKEKERKERKNFCGKIIRKSLIWSKRWFIIYLIER